MVEIVLIQNADLGNSIRKSWNILECKFIGNRAKNKKIIINRNNIDKIKPDVGVLIGFLLTERNIMFTPTNKSSISR